MGDSSTVEISGDYDALEKSLSESASLFDDFGEGVEQTASEVESVWAKVGGSIVESFSAIRSAWDSLTNEIERGFGDIVANIKNGTQEFIKMDAEVLRLAQNLKATGAVAGFTAHGLEQLNDQLKSLSVNGSDAIREAQMALLQFKNVRGDIFKDAIKSAMDFAAVTGGSLSSATEHFGRLLNDPVKGLEDLVDNGVQFTAMQIKMIEKMQKANDIVGLQRVLMDKLAESYGGAAKEQAESLWGSIERLNNIFTDIWRTIGSLLAPTLNSKLVPIMEKVGKVVKYLVDQLQSDGKLLGDAFDYAINKAQEWGEVLLDVGIKTFAVLHTAITDWDVTWHAAWSGLKFVATESLIYVLEKAQELGEYLSQMWDGAIEALGPLAELAVAAMDVIKVALMSVYEVALTVWAGILETAVWAWDNIGKVVMDWALAAIGAGYLAYHFFKNLFETLSELASIAYDVISTYFKALGTVFMIIPNALLTAGKTVFSVFTSICLAAGEAFIELVGVFHKGFAEFLSSGMSVARMWLETWLSMFSGVGAGADSLFGKVFKYLRDLGFTLVDNLMGDVKAAMQPAFDAMDRMGTKFGEAKDKAAASAADIRDKFNAAFAGMNIGSLDQIIGDLKNQTGALGGDFDKAFDVFKLKFTRNLSLDGKVLQEWKDKIKEAMDATEEPTTLLADEQFRFGKEHGEKGGGAGGKSPFEALDQIRRRIEDAAASPEVEATNKQSELMKKLHQQHMGKLDKLVDAVDDDKRSKKDAKKLRENKDLFKVGGMGF